MLFDYSKDIESELDSIFIDCKVEYEELFNAMKYSLCGGGKRIRPQLMLEFMRICGGNPKDALKFACALEMIHTYSLVHDDLPCMDNDDLRRGKPSCHKAFGEATALLAGDALLTDAFTIALSTKNIANERILKAAKVLSELSGSNGMIGGQVIDLKYEQASAPLDTIILLYKLKTAALLIAAAKIGCILAGADDNLIDSASDFAENLGVAFQIKDDILDITSDEITLGKPIGSDIDANKSTYVSHVGLINAQNDVKIYTNKALESLDIFGQSADNLRKFAKELSERKK